MSELEITQYLHDNGYPEHICRAGKDGLLAKWRKFVDEVERGYRLGLEDYRNDLDLRAILALIEADGDELDDLDSRLQAMLIGHETRVWESAPDDPWWDFGYPKNARGELLGDLRAEELIP